MVVMLYVCLVFSFFILLLGIKCYLNLVAVVIFSYLASIICLILLISLWMCCCGHILFVSE